MKKKILNILCFLFFVAINLSAQFGGDEHQLEISIKQSHQKIHVGDTLSVSFTVNIFETWHINSNKPKEVFLIPTQLTLKSGMFKIAKISYPKAKDLKFEFSEKPVSVFEGKVNINAMVIIPEKAAIGKNQLSFSLNYQACNNSSCMPPNEISKEVDIEVVTKEVAAVVQDSVKVEAVVEDSTKESSDFVALENAPSDDSFGSQIASQGLFLTLLFVFLGGLGLNLTPCVYPLIPITIGYFGGQSEGRTSKLFLLGLFYVLGMAITYSVIGVVTSLTGAVLGSLLQNSFVIIFISLIFVTLALSMFGLYEFQLPNSWVAKAGGAKTGVYGAFFMGLTMGIVAAPCIGPFVLGLLTHVATKEDPLYGFLLFFVLALGLGLPYLILALFSGKIKSLPRAGMWMNAVKHIFGFILIGMAVYFALPVFPKNIAEYLLPGYMFIAGLYLVVFDKLANNVKGFRIFKTIFSILLIGFSVYMMWPTDKKSPEWNVYSESTYKTAIDGKQKMIFDFYADWCIPCKEYDKLTFTNDEVIALSKEFANFKVDMTKSASEEVEKVRSKFNVKGVPTILFIDSQGKEVNRLTGFVDANEFLKIMKAVK